MQVRDSGPATATRSERLLELLRLDILRGVFPGGSRVTEESLADRYGVSRTPVREALRLLERESLLSYTPRAGYTVHTVDLDEMDDLYVIRCAIEEQAALRIDAASLSVLRNLFEYWSEMPASAAGGDPNLVYADEQFHEALAAAGGSTVLPSMLRTINARLHVLRIRDFIDAPARIESTFVQHAAIVESLLAGDQRLAIARLRAHILESHAYVRGRFIQSALSAGEVGLAGGRSSSSQSNAGEVGLGGGRSSSSQSNAGEVGPGGGRPSSYPSSAPSSFDQTQEISR